MGGRRRAIAALTLLLLAAEPARALDGGALRVAGNRLLDRRGREVTLRGVNARVQGIFDVTFDDGRLPLEPIPVFDAGDAARMQALGLNLLRLPISWSALEPGPGRYDEAYLDRVGAVTRLCGRRGILVLIDFHQDAFSKEIGEDGAPRWVLDLLLGPGGYPYLGGPLTDLLGRRLSPAARDAFRGLFANRGGVQDALAAAAAVVARRFRHDPAVLGYEVLNEPWALYAGVPDPDAAVLALNVRVAQAIRQVDDRHLIAFEPDTSRNQTDRAALPTAPFPVPGTLYAPHIYTAVFSGNSNPNFATGDAAELVPSMEHAAAEAAAWWAPLLVGEYGIDPTAPNANRWITAELDLQDRLRAHSAFWVWEETSQGRWGLFEGESSQPGGERVARTTALSRPYARAVPGAVLEHRFDAAANTLRVRYHARGHAPLELFIPARRYAGGFTLRCDGAPVSARRHPVRGTVRFRCGRGEGERLVELSPERAVIVTEGDRRGELTAP